MLVPRQKRVCAAALQLQWQKALDLAISTPGPDAPRFSPPAGSNKDAPNSQSIPGELSWHGQEASLPSSPPMSIRHTSSARHRIQSDQSGPSGLPIQQPPPRWSRHDADQWLSENLTRRRVVPDEALCSELIGRDHVFLIDNSYTMRAHWKNVADTVQLLSEILSKLKADNTIEVDLTSQPNDTKVLKLRDSRNIRDFVKQCEPPSSAPASDVEGPLAKILINYQMRVSRRGVRPMLMGGRKPLSLYVMTDGCSDQRSDLKRSIRIALTAFEAFEKKRHVGIQFIRFGDDPEGISRLEDVDGFLREEEQDLVRSVSHAIKATCFQV